ncbi:MAG: hypothetical protein D6790_15790 [Caldilineae bacterium]|nr:MAG: hypothetical protein D6790_15790 [Caldilineae bacterium]
MKTLISLVALFLFLGAGAVFAADLPDKDAKYLEGAGIPLYKGAVYTNGGLGDAYVGARFACNAPVTKVQAFYREKFPNWALISDQYGTWILYEGEQSEQMGAYMGKKSISVREEKQLPGWFNLSSDMTTEILIVVPPN